VERFAGEFRRSTRETAMTGTQVGKYSIEIFDRTGNLIARNAQEGVKKMPREISLNDADIKFAHALGVDPKAVAMIKYKHGRGGLSGVTLHAGTGLDGFGYPSPFHPVKPAPATDPGKITEDGGVPVRTIVEPEDSDGETVKDPAGLLTRPMRVIFPVASE
jgi:hypothetical protein